jgi:nucleoid-associated protein YgaU
MVVLSIVLLLILIISIFKHKYTRPTMTDQSFQTYTVKPGDTYWSISKSYIKGDPREFIYHLIQINGIKPEQLRPGQIIKVPVN